MTRTQPTRGRLHSQLPLLWHLPWLLTAALAAAVTPASTEAQEPSWRLPERGAAEYRRTWNATAGPVVKTAAAARAADPTDKPPDKYLPRLPPAPFLCQGELRPDHQGIGDPVRDPRDLLRAVACELGGRGLKLRFPRLLPFGDLQVHGTWSAPGPDGAQDLRATVTGRRPAPLPADRPGTADRLRVFCLGDVDGTLEVHRRVDAAAGLVPTFTARLDVVVAEGEKQFRRFLLTDEWTLLAVRDDQDADFRKRVGHAIRLGTTFVRDSLDARKSFLRDDGKEDRSYGSGRLALGLLTMLHGGVGRDDPSVAMGFAELGKRELIDSYSLAAALMALAARYAPPNEAERLRLGDPGGGPSRQLTPDDQKLAAQWTKALLRNLDPRTDPSRLLRFNYTAGPRYDTSLQQYGLLGLWSAHLCGVDVPATTFAAAARQLLAVQGPAEGPVALQLVTYRDLRAAAAGDGSAPSAAVRRAEARGFSYEEPLEPPFGSMTSAGTSGLLLARAGMAARGGTDKALEAQIDDAVGNGFAWLAKEFSVRTNPGYAERGNHHWYYWLYGLERSCELRGAAWLQGRDWYYEGALQLLAQQQPNGSFRAEYTSSLAIEVTCFAILFLSRSTPAAPVTGGGR